MVALQEQTTSVVASESTDGKTRFYLRHWHEKQHAQARASADNYGPHIAGARERRYKTSCGVTRMFINEWLWTPFPQILLGKTPSESEIQNYKKHVKLFGQLTSIALFVVLF